LWKGEIDLYANHKVTFSIDVTQSDGVTLVHYLNGAERMPVEGTLQANSGSIELLFPSYQSGIEAQIANGEMAGWARWDKPDRTYELRFRASLIDPAQTIENNQKKQYANRWALVYGVGLRR